MPPPVAEARDRVEVLRLRTRGLDEALLGKELALRVPHARIVAHDATPSGDGSMVFVDVRPGPSPRAFDLTLVTNDGRAYDRTIDSDPSSPEGDVIRLLAGNVANLVSAIEAGTARADRQDVRIPSPSALSNPACPVCPVPEPPASNPVVARPAPPPPPPPLELGIGVVPTVAIGLGEPDDADRFVGAGGALALWLRHRTGLLVGAEVRMLGRRLPLDTSSLRTRLGPALGYAWRTGSFELAATAAFGVEPWSVRAGGQRSALDDSDGAPRRRRPLLGGSLSIVPAHRFERSGVAVRIGPRLELSASSAIGDRGRVAALLVDDAGRLRTVGRLGGFELGLGLDVVVWIPTRRRATR